MDWQTFGVIAALAWGAVVLAFCTRWIFRAEAKSRREGLCLGGNLPGPLGEADQKSSASLRLCARQKHLSRASLFCRHCDGGGAEADEQRAAELECADGRWESFFDRIYRINRIGTPGGLARAR